MSLQYVVSFFGRISFLVDENTAALQFFMQALLNLFDRAGWLYGEIARLVFSLLGFRFARNKQLEGPARGGMADATNGDIESQKMAPQQQQQQQMRDGAIAARGSFGGMVPSHSNSQLMNNNAADFNRATEAVKKTKPSQQQ